MNAPTLRHGLTLAATLAVGATLLLSAADAGARERAGAGAGMQRSVPRGDYTRNTERMRTENGHVRTDRWTNANGRSVERDATVANDRASGTRTRDVDWTGPDGRTASRHDVTTKTDDGYTRDSTFTNAAGKTTTREASLVRDPEAGTRTREATTTLPDGRTRTMEDVTTRTDSGYTRDTSITNPNGSTLQRDVVASRDAATGAWSKEVTVDRTPAPKPGG